MADYRSFPMRPILPIERVPGARNAIGWTPWLRTLGRNPSSTSATVNRVLHPQTTENTENYFPLPLSGLKFGDHLVAELGTALHAVLDHSGVRYDDINARSSSVFVVGWNCQQWTPLPQEAAPHVGQARKALTRLREFSACASRDAPDRLPELTELEDAFQRLIEQPGGSYPGGAPHPTIEKIRECLDQQLTEYPAIVRRLPCAHGSDLRLLIVDTSALLDRPNLQDWTLDGQAWTVVFVPQVLSELDERKRDPHTRDAAQKVIRQLEEFDRRGDTTVGVPLAGKLTVREVVTNPNMDESLPWLRADTPDDLIIASGLELRWEDLTSRIAIAASDRNVRNKARLAGLGVVRTAEL